MWQNFKYKMAKFMEGRYGNDQLSRAILIFALVLYIISVFTTRILSFISIAILVWSIFRMYSRNKEARAKENQAFLRITGNARTNTRQFFNRLKNSKQYKYFKCPGCGARLKLPRGVGEVTVTCGKCKKQFKKKA